MERVHNKSKIMKFKKNPKIDIEKVNRLKAHGYTEDQAELLVSRGFDTCEKADAFLNFSARDLRKIDTMKDAEAFIFRLKEAIENGYAITICGDYDADGIMATHILMTGLDAFIEQTGSSCRHVEWFINDRFKEGYGLNMKSIDRLLAEHPDTQMIITCDNGIKATEAILAAIDRGVEVLVSDHHGQSEGEVLPPCPVVCEKRLDEAADGEWFCGAELARRIVSELFIRAGLVSENRDLLNSLIAYSGFATITDSVPMNGANHYVAKAGIYAMAKSPEAFWNCLKEVANTGVPDEETIGFKWGPMVNAVSRVVGSVDVVMDALCASRKGERQKCFEAVTRMMELNITRQELTAADEAKAIMQIENNGWADDLFLLVTDKKFEAGINGLTASRLVEAYGVPAIAMGPSGDGDIYKGSARSVEGFSVFEALGECRELLVGFGGHPMAAGLSCHLSDIPRLRYRLCALAKKAGVTKTDTVVVDKIFEPGELSETYLREMRKLAPFGPGFERPVIGFEGTISSRYVMKDKHIKYIVKSDSDEEVRTPVIWWNAAEHEQKFIVDPLKKHIRCIGYPSVNEYDGRKTMQFVVNALAAD